MPKTDYIYPLPKTKLHTRYDPLFSALKKGRSVSLIGLPFSARSGYLKFILEYSPQFLTEFIDPTIFKFIYLEGNLSGDQLIRSIAVQIFNQKILAPILQEELENQLRIQDPQLIYVTLKHIIAHSPQFKFIIILYEAESLLNDQPQSIQFLTGLWNTQRNQPNSRVSLLFIGSPKLLETKLLPSWLPIRPALEECTINFPLFDQVEMNYLRLRLEHLSNVKISTPIHNLAAKLSAGHTVLYRLLTQLSLSELQQINYTHTHPAINNLLQTIWSGYSNSDQQNNNTPIPILPPNIPLQEKINSYITLPKLTAQQKLLFDYLLLHIEQIITREQIAQTIWGRKWQTKYSDWAIDKSISLLKKHLNKSPLKLYTLRNRGYILKYV